MVPAKWSQAVSIRIQLFMANIEQQPPNRPNFMLILVLFGATIIAVFVIAYFVLDWDAGGLLPKRHAKHPSSQLVHHSPDVSGSQLPLRIAV